MRSCDANTSGSSRALAALPDRRGFVVSVSGNYTFGMSLRFAWVAGALGIVFVGCSKNVAHPPLASSDCVLDGSTAVRCDPAHGGLGSSMGGPDSSGAGGGAGDGSVPTTGLDCHV